MLRITNIIKIVVAIISLTSMISTCGAGIANATLSGATFEDYSAQIMRR